MLKISGGTPAWGAGTPASIRSERFPSAGSGASTAQPSSPRSEISDAATEDPTADTSRQTNLNKCETAASNGDATESDSGDRELPTVEDAL